MSAHAQRRNLRGVAPGARGEREKVLPWMQEMEVAEGEETERILAGMPGRRSEGGGRGSSASEARAMFARLAAGSFWANSPSRTFGRLPVSSCEAAVQDRSQHRHDHH